MAYLGMVLASLTLKMRQYLIFEKKKKPKHLTALFLTFLLVIVIYACVGVIPNFYSYEKRSIVDTSCTTLDL